MSDIRRKHCKIADFLHLLLYNICGWLCGDFLVVLITNMYKDDRDSLSKYRLFFSCVSDQNFEIG